MLRRSNHILALIGCCMFLTACSVPASRSVGQSTKNPFFSRSYQKGSQRLLRPTRTFRKWS